jgi:hypothetical protein
VIEIRVPAHFAPPDGGVNPAAVDAHATAIPEGLDRKALLEVKETDLEETV